MQFSLERGVGDIPKNKEDARLLFRQKVQYEIMKQMGYFDVSKDTNEVFMKWITDGRAEFFKKCYEDIVPPNSDRPEEDFDQVVKAVAEEMSIREKH